MQKRSILAVALLIATACASGGSQRPANMPRPDLRVAVVDTPFFGSGTDAPISFNVEVSNVGGEPIVVRSIRILSQGSVQVGVRPYQRVLQESIPAGQSKVFNLTSMAYIASEGGRFNPSEALNIRADAYFESGGKQFREIYNLANIPIE
jgi:hypothetical protein